MFWKAPGKHIDREHQVQSLRQAIARNVDGIPLAPVDAKALCEPVMTAAEQRIPVVIFDSALEGEAGRDFVSFVAADNRAAARIDTGAELVTLSNIDDPRIPPLLRYNVVR